MSILGLAACAGAYEDLDPQQFAQALGAGDIALVDVRTAQEYAAGHIPGRYAARNLLPERQAPRRGGIGPVEGRV